MNVLNRAIVIILLVILIVLLAVLIFLAAVSPEASFAVAEQAVTSAQANLNFLTRVIFTVVALVLLVICLLLLWLEIRRPEAKAVQVQELKDGAAARVSVDSIVQRLEYNIDRLQDVISVRPVVKGKSHGVDVTINLQTSPEIDVPMKTEEVVQLTHEVVEGQMGLKLHNVSVEIRHAPYPEEDVL